MCPLAYGNVDRT